MQRIIDQKIFEEFLDETTKIFNVLMVNAKYSALSFYKKQKGTFLKDDEIIEISTNVNNDIEQAVNDAALLLKMSRK